MTLPTLDLWYLILAGVGGLIGYLIRHSQAGPAAGLPPEVAQILAAAAARKREREAQQAVADLLAERAPPPAPPGA